MNRQSLNLRKPPLEEFVLFVILTGGDADSVRTLLRREVSLEPFLVFQGLAMVAEATS